MNIAEKELLLKQDFDDVYEAGKQVYEKAFWDNYLNTTNFTCAFAGYRWNTNNLRPNKDLVPISANRMFHFNIIADLKGHFENLGRKLDTSKCTDIAYMFLNSGNKHIPTISLESAKSCSNLFAYATELITIEQIIFSESNTSYGSAFANCKNLEHVLARGIIPVSIDLKSCKKLDLESLHSVISCLKYYYDDNNNKYKYTLTLSQESMDLLDEECGPWRDEIDMAGWNLA